MILEWFSFPGKIATFWSGFSADFCRRAKFSVPELKLMTSRKYQNARLLALPESRNFDIEQRIT
jgi:hypothetical protein